MTTKLPYIGALFLCAAIGFGAGHLRQKPRAEQSRRILYYVDPMHPSYRSSKPGIAPDCGMPLEPVYAEDAVNAAASNRNIAGVTEIAPAVQQLYGIRLARAERSADQGSVRLFGRVEAEDTLIYRVDFGADGYVRETYNDAVGNQVKKNQRLGAVYSPDFLAVAGGYLAANERTPGAPNAARDYNPSSPTGVQNSASVLARADRLRNLGMSDAQIDEITQTKKLPEDVYIVSPVDGFILTRTVSPGMRVERQTQFYTIGDLSRVWIEAEVFGRDAQSLKVGTTVSVMPPDSDQKISARVLALLPDVDPVTHAAKVRLEASNPGFKLRPGMFVDVNVPVSLPSGLSVPVESVLDSGLEKRVFVETAQSRFEPRVVETGWQAGDRVEIVRGLHEGEAVVSAGTFLVDSESRLRSGAQPGSSAAGISKMNDAMRPRSN